MRCRHCRSREADRPRGLCGRCWFSLGSRGRLRYQPVEGQVGVDFHAKSLPGQQTRMGKVPKERTDARAGTEAKLRVMERRVKRGESVFRDDDGPQQEELE